MATAKEYCEYLRTLTVDKAWLSFWKYLELYCRDLELSQDKFAAATEFLHQKKMCLNFCRGGGKTLLMSCIAVFLAVYYGAGMWIASSRQQLTRAFHYFNKINLIKPFKISKNRTQVETVEDIIVDTIPATEQSMLGAHVQWIIYDEVARIDKQFILLSRGCLLKDAYELYGSTPVKGSFFEELTLRYYTETLPYTDCSWLPIKQIEEDKQTLFQGLEQLWDREYLCKFTALEGAIFHNLFISSDNDAPTMAGVDFQVAIPHKLVCIKIDGNKLYVCKEIEIPQYPYENVAEHLRPYTKMYDIEVESGGINEMFNRYLKDAKVNVKYFSFDEKSKIQKLTQLLKYDIYINPKQCPHTYQDLTSASWQQDGKGEAKILKNDEFPMHYLDALLHAVHTTKRLNTPIWIGEQQTWSDLGYQ